MIVTEAAYHGPDAVDDFLKHHGVKGMKWGYRRGRGKTGMSRSSGALLDRNARLRNTIELAKSGQKYRGTAAVGRAFVGREQQKSNWAQMTKNLNAQDKRIKAGKLTVADRMDKFGSLSLGSLYVSKRPDNAPSPYKKTPKKKPVAA